MDSKTNGFGVAKLDADKVTEHMELYDCCEISARRVMVYDIIMKDIQLLMSPHTQQPTDLSPLLCQCIRIPYPTYLINIPYIYDNN